MCMLCSAAFVSPAKLRRHQLTHHAEVRPKQTAMVDRASGSLIGQGLLPLDKEEEAAQLALRKAELRRAAQEAKRVHKGTGTLTNLPSRTAAADAEPLARSEQWGASTLPQLAEQSAGPSLTLPLTVGLQQLADASFAGWHTPSLVAAGQRSVEAESHHGDGLPLARPSGPGGVPASGGAVGGAIASPCRGADAPEQAATVGSSAPTSGQQLPSARASAAEAAPATSLPASAVMPQHDFLATIQQASLGRLQIPESAMHQQGWSGTATPEPSADQARCASSPSDGSEVTAASRAAFGGGAL